MPEGVGGQLERPRAHLDGLPRESAALAQPLGDVAQDVGVRLKGREDLAAVAPKTVRVPLGRDPDLRVREAHLDKAIHEVVFRPGTRRSSPEESHRTRDKGLPDPGSGGLSCGARVPHISPLPFRRRSPGTAQQHVVKPPDSVGARGAWAPPRVGGLPDPLPAEPIGRAFLGAGA